MTREIRIPANAGIAGAVFTSGQPVNINLTAAPLIDANDNRMGSMLVLEDITSEKRVRSTMACYMSRTRRQDLRIHTIAERRTNGHVVSIGHHRSVPF